MRQKYGLAVAVLVLIATLLVPTPPELSTAGHRMLAVLLFSVIVWMSESVSYPVSASIITGASSKSSWHYHQLAGLVHCSGSLCRHHERCPLLPAVEAGTT